MDRLRARLDGWLGEPRREQGQGVRLVYRFESEVPPVVRLKLKIETNTRDHFTALGTMKMPFTVASRWWNGTAIITTYRLEELLGTKLHALFQRKKGRDLVDLVVALEAGIDPTAVVDVFRAYVKAEGREITRAIFEENLDGKLRLPAFMDDIAVLLPPGTTFDLATGAARVANELVALLPGAPWKGRSR
jgi:predicted nucleotidyltransferase component of viral defense system